MSTYTPHTPGCLETLPNELLAKIMNFLPSSDVLPLAGVNHRFLQHVASLLNHRILEVGCLPENDLILECYLPSKKISTPYLFCQYQYMNTKDEDGENAKVGGNWPEIRKLHCWYSSFRPVMANENRRPRPWGLEEEEEDEPAVSEDIFLDEDELFSQLCCKTNLVKTGPRPGLYLSHVNIKDGVLRIWREWLAKAVEAGSENTKVLWVDDDRSIGIRFSVVHGAAERMPVLTGPDDLPAVYYKLHYEELLVRSSKLLLAAEQSEVQEVSHSGKAVVIASM